MQVHWGSGLLVCLPWLILGLFAGDARGVLFYSTSDPEFNTVAPDGEFAGSGWRHHGLWGKFTGVVIGPRQFITVGHVRGSPGDLFVLDGKEYRTLVSYDHSGSDLTIWTVCGRFPDFAELYDKDDETGSEAVVFGRGTQRGEEVVLPGVLGDELKGWRWGASDSRLRWGENTVAGTSDDSGIGPFVTGSPAEAGDSVGPLLRLDFNADGGVNQAHLSAGDSGGGLFIREGSTWKLAGINYAVDGPYNTEDSGDGFDAAIFDEGGLYKRNNGEWSRTSDLPTEQPGSFYVIRISAHRDWIEGILEETEIDGPSVRLEWAASLDGEYSRDLEAEVNEEEREIRTAIPESDDKRFFRIESCAPREISAISEKDQVIVIHFK